MTARNKMYYNRTISSEFSRLLENGGELRWLFNFVKNHKELDFLIGKTESKESKEWVSVYRGLTKILSISPTHNFKEIQISADDKYINMSANLFGKKSINDNFQKEIESLIAKIEIEKVYDRYYKNKNEKDGKEGFFQNELSKKYGISGNANDDFVIIDKEAVIGYLNKKVKGEYLGQFKSKYKQLQEKISEHNPGRYGKNLVKKPIGNELDFLALDKEGNVLLIEYKHGTNTSGIYLSPLQIGMYYDLFANFPKESLEKAIFEMLDQKQKIGLINSNWKKPNCIKEIIPILMVSEFNYKSSAKIKFDEILQFTRNQHGTGFLKNLQTYNFTMKNGITNW